MTCVVCGATAAAEAFTAEDWALGAVEGPFRYVRCADCGTVRADPQPSAAALAQAYPPAYVGRGLAADVLRRVGDAVGLREARRLVALAGPTGRALDAGCGDGTFLRRLQRAGWVGRVHGLEPGAGASAARARGIDVAEVPIEEYDAEHAFDLVILRHVIEHVRDPRAVLERVRSLLRPGGVAYVATPDEGALSARVFGRFWHGYDPPRHLWVFRPPALRRLHAETGLHVVDERWSPGPEVWTASLGYVLARRPGRRRLPASHLNPLAAAPAVALAAVEVATRRSTMYGLVSRRA